MNKRFQELISTYGISDNESYIKSELYHRCRIREITIYLEQCLKGCGRPDAIIIINEYPVIIECKRISATINIYDDQFVKYNKSKLPILILNNEDIVDEALDFLLEQKKLKGIYLRGFTSQRFENHQLKEITEKNYREFKIHRMIDKIDSENNK
jgi:hypothetical protein